MRDFLELAGSIVGTIIMVVAGIIGTVFLVIAICEGSSYAFSKSYCTAYVAGEKVYEGRCHFLSINSIGENGNTKDLTIYEDVLKFKAVKEFVNDDIRVEGN